MPAAKIGLDLDSRNLLGPTGARIQGFSGKVGNIIDYELAIKQAGTPINLPSGSSVEFGLKQVASPAGTYLYHTTARRSGWGTGSRWFFRLDLDSDVFGVPAVLGKVLDSEIIMIVPDGQRISSLTFAFTVLKNVIP